MKISLDGDEIIEGFVEQMITDKGVDGPENKDELVEMVNERIMDAVVGALSDEGLERLNRALETDDEKTQDRVNAAILGAGVDMKEVMAETLATVRQEYLEG